MSQKDKNKIIFPGKCIDAKDPMMMGRIRAILLTETTEEVKGSIPSYCAVYDKTNKNKIIDIKEECKWTIDDPFLFLPLLPFYVSQNPQEDEYINILFANKENKYQDQYYIQGPFSSPMATSFEHYMASNSFLGTGTRNKTTTSIKNTDGTYKNALSEGIFPEPEDNGILGRGSADVIVKKDEVLVRAGKVVTQLNPKQLPTNNPFRSFLQISNFSQTRIDLPEKTGAVLKEQIQVVQKVIEWNIFNLNNSSNAFTGEITLHNIKPDVKSNSSNLSVDSDITNLLSAPLFKVTFVGESFETVVYKITTFIKGVNSGNIFLGPTQSFSVPGERFPFVFRPNPAVYNYIKYYNGTTNSLEFANATKFFQSIFLNQSDKYRGFGLIFEPDKPGPLYDPIISKIKPSEYQQRPISYAALGGDKVYLLSHQSEIPKMGKIDLQGTIYGIKQEKFLDEILPKTNSMVRGEELMALINLITKFLVSHVHAFPGLPPIPVGIDGTQTQEIFTSLLNAPNTILNQNIRIN